MNHDKPQTKQHFTGEMIGALSDAFGKSFLTIQRWVEKNDDRLTSEKAKRVLEKFQMVHHDVAA